MAINPFIKALFLPILPSRQKWLFILAPHLVAFSIVLIIVVFTLWVKLVFSLAIVTSYIYYHLLHISQKLKCSVLVLEQDSAGNWLITISKKNNIKCKKTVEFLSSSFISKYFILLNFKDDDGTNYRVLITPDSLSRIDNKHLYIRLKSTYIK